MVALAAAAAQAGAVVGVVVDAVGLAPVVDAALPAGADRAAVDEVTAADVAVRAAVDAAKARVATVRVDVEMVEASSSRT